MANNIDSSQIRASCLHGNGYKLQLFSGNAQSGNVAGFDANGNIVDLGSTISGSQTPWLQNIDGGGFVLQNVSSLGVGSAGYPQYALDVTGTGRFSAQVGIGSGSPSFFTKLDILSAGTYEDILIHGASPAIRLNDTDNGQSSFAIYVDSNALQISIYASGNGAAPNAGSSLATILSSGNVGIGKSPSYALDVNGDCNITGTYRVNGVPLGSQTPWTSDINAANYKLYSAGSIGIGTASPVMQLQVGPAQGLLVISTAPNDLFGSANLRSVPGIGWQYIVAGGGSLWQLSAGSEFHFYTAPTGGAAGATAAVTDRLTILSSGNVGIGTALPGLPLDVAATDCYIRARTTAAAATDTRLVADSVGGCYVGSWSNHDFGIAANGGLKLVAKAGGGISIPNLPSTNPGAGSKQLWYDPADSNRVKFAA